MSAICVSSPMSLTTFWLPFCSRGRSFPAVHRCTGASAWGRVSGPHSSRGLCINSLQLGHQFLPSLGVWKLTSAPVSILGCLQHFPPPSGETGFFACYCFKLPHLGVSSLTFWGKVLADVPFSAPQRSGPTHTVTLWYITIYCIILQCSISNSGSKQTYSHV